MLIDQYADSIAKSGGRHRRQGHEGNPENAGAGMSSIDVEDRAEQLEAMIRRLINLVSAEAAAVQAHRLSAANADWDEKERLVHAWRLEVSRIKADRKPAGRIVPAAKGTAARLLA